MNRRAVFDLKKCNGRDSSESYITIRTFIFPARLYIYIYIYKLTLGGLYQEKKTNFGWSGPELQGLSVEMKKMVFLISNSFNPFSIFFFFLSAISSRPSYSLHFVISSFYFFCRKTKLYPNNCKKL